MMNGPTSMPETLALNRSEVWHVPPGAPARWRGETIRWPKGRSPDNRTDVRNNVPGVGMRNGEHDGARPMNQPNNRCEANPTARDYGGVR